MVYLFLGSYWAGVGFGDRANHAPWLQAAGFGIFLGLVTAWLLGRRTGTRIKSFSFPGAFALVAATVFLGFALGAWRLSVAHGRLEHAPEEYLGRFPVRLEGTVLREPETGGGRVRLVVRVETPSTSVPGDGDTPSAPGGFLVLLTADALPDPDLSRASAGRSSDKDASPGDLRDLSRLSYGDRILFTARLRQPRAAGNPGEFSYRNYLHSMNIAATGFLSEGRRVELISRGSGGGWLPRVALGLRSRAAATFERLLSREKAGLLESLIFGAKGRVAPDLREAFRKAGASHLLAVSGLHVGVVVGFLLLLARGLRLPGKSGAVMGMAGVLVYVLSTGAPPSALRAGLMTSAGLLAVLFGRRKDSHRFLGVSAQLLLLANPHLVFDTGFRLSFGATSGILWLAEPIRRLGRCLGPSRAVDLLARSVSVSVSAQLGVLPILMRDFGEVSPVSTLSNLFLVPLAGVLVPLGLLLGVVGPFVTWFGRILVPPVELLGGLFAGGARQFARLPFASLEAPYPSDLSVLAYYLCLPCIAVLSAPRGGSELPGLPWEASPREASQKRRGALVAVTAMAMLASVWWPIIQGLHPKLVVSFIDVGQGDSILVQAPGGGTMLVDAGGRPVSGVAGRIAPGQALEGFDVGEDIVVPFLRRAGVRRVDVAVATHPHEDHIQGLLAVLRWASVGTVLDGGQPEKSPSSRQFEEIIAQKRIPKLVAREGMTVRLGQDVEVEVLHPPGRLLAGTGSDVNNNSVVMRLVYRKTAVLLTGDLDYAGQAFLTRTSGELSGTVLKVPHHGSRNAMNKSFINRVHPRVAVIQVGPNSFEQPSQEVLDALWVYGSEVFRNDTDGAVIFHTDGRKFDVRGTRSRRRFGGEISEGNLRAAGE